MSCAWVFRSAARCSDSASRLCSSSARCRRRSSLNPVGHTVVVLIGVADADTEEVLVVGGGEGGDIGCEVAVSSDLAAGDFPIVEGEVRGGGGGGAGLLMPLTTSGPTSLKVSPVALPTSLLPEASLT